MPSVCARSAAATDAASIVPPGKVAAAYAAALAAVVIELAGQAPYDVELAERAARGLLGLPPSPHTERKAHP
jgi:hypothetical protein